MTTEKEILHFSEIPVTIHITRQVTGETTFTIDNIPREVVEKIKEGFPDIVEAINRSDGNLLYWSLDAEKMKSYIFSE